MGQPRTQKPAQNQQPVAERPKGSMAVRRADDGALEALEIPSETAADLRQSGPTKIGDYFGVAFGRQESRVSDDDRRHREFVRLMRDTACFYCRDNGLIPVLIRQKTGTYDFQFACACEAGQRYAGTCRGIGEIEHLHPLACALAQDCALKARDERCKRFACPKFR